MIQVTNINVSHLVNVYWSIWDKGLYNSVIFPISPDVFSSNLLGGFLRMAIKLPNEYTWAKFENNSVYAMSFTILNERKNKVWEGHIKILDEKYFIDTYNHMEKSFQTYRIADNAQKK